MVPQLRDVAELWSGRYEQLGRLRDGTFRSSLGRDPLEIPSTAVLAGGLLGTTCFRLPDATVRCMGTNYTGAVGDGTTRDARWPVDPGLRGVRSLAAGLLHTCAALTDGSVWCWGDTTDGAVGPTAAPTEYCDERSSPKRMCVTRPARVSGIDHVEQVFAGLGVTCASRSDRSIWCWGLIEHGRIARTPVQVPW
ncbi:MAG: hypothetical protein U0325_28720 [Polyangiales bacterium]